MTKEKIIEQRLLCPFTADDIDIRAGAGAGTGKNVPLFYITTRAVDKRLRQIFGLGGYSVESVEHTIEQDTVKKKRYIKQGESNRILNSIEKTFEKEEKTLVSEKEVWTPTDYDINTGLLVATTCKIKVHCGDLNFTMCNVGEKGLDETGFNKVTSSYAQAFKRAASNMGVGAYLYYLKDIPGVSFTNNKCNLKASDEPVKTKIHEGLDEVGFLFECEETGNIITDWTICARSMEKCGRVLSVEGFKALKEKGEI